MLDFKRQMIINYTYCAVTDNKHPLQKGDRFIFLFDLFSYSLNRSQPAGLLRLSFSFDVIIIRKNAKDAY